MSFILYAIQINPTNKMGVPALNKKAYERITYTIIF